MEAMNLYQPSSSSCNHDAVVKGVSIVYMNVEVVQQR
jgi:hypothetical protein